MAAQLGDADRALVGELVVTCTGLEHLAVIALTIVIDADFGKLDLAIKRMQHSDVLDALARLASPALLRGDILERWKSWIKASREIAVRRNDVVHTMWSSVGPNELEGLKRAPFRSVRASRLSMEKIVQDANDALRDGLFLLVDLMNATKRKGTP